MKSELLKATEHDKYENIAGSGWACSWAVMEMQITAHAAPGWDNVCITFFCCAWLSSLARARESC
jgi:hypothetical protein